MNSALTSHLQYADNDLLVHRANYKILQLALVQAGYEENRFAVLEPACQTNLVVMEDRKAEWVEVYLNALGTGVNLDTFPDINDCELGSFNDAVLAGTFATLTTNITGADNDIVYTAKKVGTAGNAVQVQYAGLGVSQPLTIVVTGNLVKINARTSAASAPLSTASEIVAAVNADALANNLVSAKLKAPDTGAGVIAIMSATNLAGGVNA